MMKLQLKFLIVWNLWNKMTIATVSFSISWRKWWHFKKYFIAFWKILPWTFKTVLLFLTFHGPQYWEMERIQYLFNMDYLASSCTHMISYVATTNLCLGFTFHLQTTALRVKGMKHTEVTYPICAEQRFELRCVIFYVSSTPPLLP